MPSQLMEVHRAFLEAHMRYMRVERNVSTPAEYLDEYLGFDDIAAEYNRAPLDLVYRVPNFEPSDVMLVLKNPNMTSGSITSEDRFLNNFLSESDSRVDRIRKISRVTSSWFSRWLGDHPGPRVRMKQLVRLLSDVGYIYHVEESEKYLSPDNLLSEQDTIPDPNEADIPSTPRDVAGVFNNIYVTNICKFRAPTGDWPLFVEETAIAKYYLRKEIRVVEPHLVIGAGNWATDVLREMATARIKEDLFKLNMDSNGESYLLLLPHPSYPPADYESARECIEFVFDEY